MNKNIFYDLEASHIQSMSNINLLNVNVSNVTTCGPLGGIYYNGSSELITHSWGVYGVNPITVNSVSTGSFMMNNISERVDNVSVLANSAPYGNRNQLGIMVGDVTSNNIKLNITNLSDGTPNDAGFSCTIFGYIPPSVMTNCENTSGICNNLADISEFISDVDGNNINLIHNNDYNCTNTRGEFISNSGLLAYGEIIKSKGGFNVFYAHPKISLSHVYIRNSGGQHMIYTNIPHTNFSCNASHVYGNNEDSICQVLQVGSNIELRSRYSRGNNSWVDRTIYWSIYGVI